MEKITLEVLLEENKKHLVDIDGELDISVVGYNLLNKFTEISLLEPDKIIYEGREVENPLVIKNNIGEIDEVRYKCLAVGYGPNGHISVTSSMIIYRPEAYLLKDLIGIIVADEKAGRITKESLLKEQEKALGYYIPFKNDLIVYVDMNNVSVIKAFDRYIENRLFAERIAQSLCKRNALKQHPALSNILTEIEGEEGFRRSKVKLTVPLHDNLTREQLIKLAETEANVKLLGTNIEYKETELLTSEKMLGINNSSSSNTASNTAVNNSSSKQEAKKTNENKSEEYKTLLNKVMSIDKNKRDNVFKTYFIKKHKSYSELNEGELKFIIKQCEK